MGWWCFLRSTMNTAWDHRQNQKCSNAPWGCYCQLELRWLSVNRGVPGYQATKGGGVGVMRGEVGHQRLQTVALLTLAWAALPQCQKKSVPAPEVQRHWNEDKTRSDPLENQWHHLDIIWAYNINFAQLLLLHETYDSVWRGLRLSQDLSDVVHSNRRSRICCILESAAE